MGRLAASCVVFLGLLAATLSAAECSEFGNIFGSSDAARKSRAASAMALQGIEQLLSALRSRELEESDGVEAMQGAVTLLRTSSVMMKAIVDGANGEFPDSQLSTIDQSVMRNLESAGAIFGVERPQSLKSLYSNFAEATDVLSGAIEKALSEPGAPIFPRISSTLAYYFDYASLTTTVAQSIQ